jgi:hypothetical protein
VGTSLLILPAVFNETFVLCKAPTDPAARFLNSPALWARDVLAGGPLVVSHGR